MLQVGLDMKTKTVKFVGLTPGKRPFGCEPLFMVIDGRRVPWVEGQVVSLPMLVAHRVNIDDETQDAVKQAMLDHVESTCAL